MSKLPFKKNSALMEWAEAKGCYDLPRPYIPGDPESEIERIQERINEIEEEISSLELERDALEGEIADLLSSQGVKPKSYDVHAVILHIRPADQPLTRKYIQ